MDRPMPEENRMKSLVKAMRIIEQFSVSFPELGVTEMSRLTGVIKSSVHSILTTFQSMGYVEKNKATNKYRLGIRFLEFYSILFQMLDYRQTVIPCMQELAAEFKNTVSLGLISDYQLMYLHREDPPTATLKSSNPIGVKRPPHCTALGKALMAYSDPEIVRGIVSRGLPVYTERTIRDEATLLRELEAIRTSGYAVDNMESEHGILCVAVPIFDRDGHIRYAMSTSGPSVRFTKKDIEYYARKLMEKAGAVRASVM